MTKIISRIGATAMLATLLVVGWQALFAPSAAAVTCDGPGEIECEGHESEGHDRFCPEIWWFFKHCYEKIYYRSPEPEEVEYCTAPGVPGTWECDEED